MFRTLFAFATCLALPAFAQGPVAAPAAAPGVSVTIRARAERESAIYHRGEKVTFNVTVEDGGKPVPSGTVDWMLWKDGVPLSLKGKSEISNGHATVTGQLDEPGFLQLRVSYRIESKAAPTRAPAPPLAPLRVPPSRRGESSITVNAMAGAGIDPTEIQRSMPVPDDFDAFWNEQKAKLAKIPANPALTPETSPSKNLEVFDLQATCLGAPVSGYYVRPVGAKPKSLPAILLTHGAGVTGSSLGSAASWAARGFIALDINAHGIPNGRPESFYKELDAGRLKNYRFEGRDSRDTLYFLGMFLRLIRAIDVMTVQPEWDGKTVVVFGTSQGGFQALAAAGLDSRVTFFGAGVPAGCDHTGMVAGRIAGWPKLVINGQDGNPVPAILNTARYFDTMNFATRTHAKGCAFTTGFIDTTCPPTSVYATYNQLQIPKQIYNDILSGHANTPEATNSMIDAVMKHIASVK